TTPLPRDDPVIILESHQVRSTMRKIDITKAAGPDSVPGHTLKSCADRLAGVFTNIFNPSLQHALVPTCRKTTTIFPVPKKQQVRCLKDYRPVTLTPIIMKCFERLVLPHIKASILTDLDSHQFAYRGNRSMEDAISTSLHTSLSHLEHPNTYVKMLFVDFTSAFNTIVPHKQTTECQIQFSVETPDCLREEAVQQSGCEGPNATVPLSRWQEGEECV
ncbi:hypothetical protein QTP70_010013, partial [Hemibagrus guttatus]